MFVEQNLFENLDIPIVYKYHIKDNAGIRTMHSLRTMHGLGKVEVFGQCMD